MTYTLRKQKSAYALSLLFCLIGILAILTTLWKIWPQISVADNPFSTFLILFWDQKLEFIPNIEFRLVYLMILGDVMIVSGVLIWILSRRWFYLPGKTLWFQCPFCKKKWRSGEDKGLVHCPHCRQLIHPRMVK